MKNIEPRQLLIYEFEKLILKHSLLDKIKSAAIIGGSAYEPEGKLISKFVTSIDIYGIENDSRNDNFHYFDLNIFKSMQKKYDLIICNQVLEHLYNLESAMKNLSHLLETNGYLWLTAPASNFRHGSPEYFSAGYSAEFFITNSEKVGLESIEAGEISAKRTYFMRHILHVWPTNYQIYFPLFSYFGVEGNLFKKLAHQFSTLSFRIVLQFISKKIEINGKYGIETFGLFQKIR
jgi:SAM-dependent methyltransferase